MTTKPQSITGKVSRALGARGSIVPTISNDVYTDLELEILQTWSEAQWDHFVNEFSEGVTVTGEMREGYFLIHNFYGDKA